jgi:type IV pilus assembly protein PilW
MFHFDERNRGFTLVELMMVLVLSAIVGAFIYRNYVSLTVSYDLQEQLLELQQNLRLGMTRVTREIRMAGYDPGGLSNAGFKVASENKLRFTANFNGNDKDTDPGEDITFSVENGELKRNGETIVDNVEVLAFKYYDANGAETTTLADIRTVEVSMVVKTTNEDYSFTDNNEYKDRKGNVIYTADGDNFHRKVASIKVRAHNMGL